MSRCAVRMLNQGRFKVKVQHSTTVFCVRTISFEPLVGFSNYSAQMSSMISRCAVRMFDQGRFKVTITIL